ncbi:hypothetical protein CW731_06465 [Polaribacter sp. ALD11]|uniref:HYC_CC_PP family protein n=1 Tax=Polaribacter sp. ALD11 TaxID=2058137 RepID=UPI000C3188D9|nr:hypothetical protein [Polaribacter sp. ALD11]AUC84955.1 hypothetical protein CW731_06465 [Polaribacter sp. ALD11]
MKQTSHKIISIVLAFVVLFSTMSFTFSMHFCGDILVETAMFHKAEGCGMEMEKPSKEGCAITNDNCCNEEQLVVDGQDELQLQVAKISFEQQIFIAAFVYSYSNLFEDLDSDLPSYATYKSPLVTSQIFKLDETYLI